MQNLGRYDKYTLGADLRNLSREVLKLIQRANSEDDRVETLKQVRSTVEEANAVLRLARESGAIQKARSYEFAAERMVNIGRQNEGWISYERTAEGHNRARRGLRRPSRTRASPDHGAPAPPGAAAEPVRRGQRSGMRVQAPIPV